MELDARDAELARIRDEKDAELAIMQEGMDATIKQLNDMQLNQGENDQAVNAQIDTLILDNTKKLNAIIDSILQACVDKVDDALYELESPTGSGNTTATPEYVLSMIEKGTTSTNEFATVFSLYLSDEVGGEHVEVIKRANQLAQTISDTLTSTKGITRLAQSDDAADKLISTGRETGKVLLRFFSNLQSYRLAGVAPAQRRDVVARQNMEARSAFANLNSVVETMVKAGNTMLANANGDIGDIVEREMMNAASAIDAATAKLQALLSRPRDHNKYSAVDLQVHDAILEASLAITRAIAGLIKAATESQQEIVARDAALRPTNSSTRRTTVGRKASSLPPAPSPSPPPCSSKRPTASSWARTRSNSSSSPPTKSRPPRHRWSPLRASRPNSCPRRRQTRTRRQSRHRRLPSAGQAGQDDHG